MTRRAGVFSYSKSITETLLWAQKGWGGPAPIGQKHPRKQRFEEKLDVTCAKNVEQAVNRQPGLRLEDS